MAVVRPRQGSSSSPESACRFGHGTLARPPFPTVTAAFYHHAAKSPGNVAVRHLAGATTRELTYQELATQAQHLASLLRERGLRPGQRVPLIVKRGVDMVVAILAVLSCGAQYVPLDGGVVPDETIRRVLDQAEGSIVLCLKSTKHRIATLHAAHNVVVVDELEPSAAEGALKNDDELIDLAELEGGCYVIYTSGTTGSPKGVDVTHSNVTNLVCLSPGNLGVGPGTSVGQVLNISFDMAAWEIFSCLCNGGTLVLRGSQWEPTLWEIDVLICTPTILSRYHPEDFPRIKTVATAGEPTTQRLADLWARDGSYWNCCGPTETTIVNTMHKHVVGAELSIGRPTPNNMVYILDEGDEPVPVGVSGVMWAGGHGVSRGYVGLESKTAEMYRRDHFADDGSLMYNTGDLGRWRHDGSIEILGRVDDQVKVKGFRVELDGVATSLASAQGVSRASSLLINGEIHGFVCPSACDVDAITRHARESQPYYAVPARIHLLDHLPETANGKVDKKALTALALGKQGGEGEGEGEKDITVELKSQTSMSTLSTVTLTEKWDLTKELPTKKTPQPFRGLRHRVFIVYRTLFSLVGILNLAALVSVLALSLGSRWLGTITAINLASAVLVRQDMVINGLYAGACSVPKQLPLWIRTRCAKIYHLGGVHSAAGVCATIWLLVSTLVSTFRSAICTEEALCGELKVASLATQVVSWLLCGLCSLLVASAWPSFRKQHHDLFERFHRFAGWMSLGLFWVRTILSSIDDAQSERQPLGLAVAKSPDFWLLLVATCSVASSWFSLRRVAVDAEMLSEHAVRLHFDDAVPVNGTFRRVSQRPLLEWHSFATIPAPEATHHRARGYSLVVSNAGDWTRACIRNPPTKLWVRGVPTCGVMRIATLFNRLVVIATGSGIGPLLGHINQQSCPTQLIWSTPQPEATFGKELVGAVREKIPDAIIHDTRLMGRPDLVRMGFNLARHFGAEAVIVIANEKITKKIVYGLESRGVPAYGAIWDS